MEGEEAEGEEGEVMSVAIFYGACVEVAIREDGCLHGLAVLVMRVFAIDIDGLTCRARKEKP